MKELANTLPGEQFDEMVEKAEAKWAWIFELEWLLLVFSIVSFFPLLSACLSYLPSLSVLFILSLPFFPLPPSPFLIYFFPLAFPFFPLSSPLLPFLLFLPLFFSLAVRSFSSLFISFHPFLTLFFFFFSPLPFWSSFLLLFLPPMSLSSLYLDLLTSYEQAQELLEMKKVFLLEIIASANPPPSIPEQAPSSTKTVSNDGCAKRGEKQNRLTKKSRDLSQILPWSLLGRGVDSKISV